MFRFDCPFTCFEKVAPRVDLRRWLYVCSSLEVGALLGGFRFLIYVAMVKKDYSSYLLYFHASEI